MLVILGLNPAMIENPLPSRYLTLILHSLLDLCPAASLNSLNLLATLLTLPERNELRPPSVSLVSMLVILGLDPAMIENPLPSRYLTLILHSLLDLCPAAS